MRKRVLLILMAMIPFFAFSQNQGITGKIIGEDNQPIPGVTIMIKGSTTGTITDIDGMYNISAKIGDILVFSFVGMENQEVTISGPGPINITMKSAIVSLDELVVVGYGVQKKKLNTGATLNMKGDELQKLNTSDAMSSLQGISPGVSITNESGRPGAGTKVNIRGIGTIGNSQPLYVVDGVQVGNIDYLNPSDIENIDVLKDAASSAIYGSQAANGVILVTTRNGKAGQKILISYDNYFGVQQVAKEPKMLNAQDYITAMNESCDNVGQARWDFSGVPRYNEIVAGTYHGTDWFNTQVNKNAGVQSHAINVTGGTEKSAYAFGFSHLHNEGLLGKQGNPDFTRITARMNSQHVLKQWNGLDLLVFGENLTYTNTDEPNFGTGGIYDNNVRSHIATNPLLPLYDENGEYTTELPLDNSTNPTAYMEYTRKYSENNANNLVGNAYVELQPMKDLKIRSSYGITNTSGAYRNWIPQFYQSSTVNNTHDSVSQGTFMKYTWIFTNTISYNFRLAEVHNLNIVLGQEAQQTKRDLKLYGRNQESIFQDWDHAYLTNTPLSSLEYVRMWGRDDYGWAMSSYFGRIAYDYNERYLLNAIVRRDGSTNFGSNKRYAVFPSVSLGWIVSQEDFMSSIPQIDYLKLRGSWGQNGNQSIPPFYYNSPVIYQGANYSFGMDRTNNTIGSQLQHLPNPNLKWETSEQLNIGMDLNLFNSKLQTSFDWYNKQTKDWLIVERVLATAGAAGAYKNMGKVTNKGIEASIKYTDKVSDFKYSVTATMGYNKNEVTRIENGEGIIHGANNSLWQGAPESYRTQEGYPIGYFWGYKTSGIMKTQAEVEEYVNGLRATAEAYAAANNRPVSYDSRMTVSKLAPGEARFQDLNKDGKITALDKTDIGDPNPKFTYGLQLYLEYKNFDFQLVGIGKSGHQIMMSYSSASDRLRDNMTYDYFNKAFDINRNPNGTMPRITSSPNSRVEISDLHVYDANYFRISNITLGYNFKNMIKSQLFSDLRLFVTGQNLFTFTKYPGMSPEVGWGNGDVWASGIDVGLYPLAKTYMAGLSVKF